jgi:predicted transcriptional regulator of viral defense system
VNRLAAFEHLRRLGSPVFRTGEAALALGEPDSTAQATLDVLAKRGLLTRLRRGWWLLPGPEPLDVGSLAPHLAAPFRAYVSFEAALFRHGWITQIPPRVTVATLGRGRRIATAVGTFELRQLPPEVFGPGDAADPPWLATPEKAALDWAYRAAHGGYRSARFPEVEPTDRVDAAALARYVARIPSSRVRATTARILQQRMKLPTAADIDKSLDGRTGAIEGRRSPGVGVPSRDAAILE